MRCKRRVWEYIVIKSKSNFPMKVYKLDEKERLVEKLMRQPSRNIELEISKLHKFKEQADKDIQKIEISNQDKNSFSNLDKKNCLNSDKIEIDNIQKDDQYSMSTQNFKCDSTDKNKPTDADDRPFSMQDMTEESSFFFGSSDDCLYDDDNFHYFDDVSNDMPIDFI